MNKFLRVLLYVVAMIFATDIFSQTIDPVTVSNGVVTLKGKGKLGTTKDAAQWRRYKFARSGNFYLSAYFRSLSNSSSSFTGIAFRNESTGQKTDGGIPMVGLFFENDTLKLKTKLSDNTKIIDVVALPNVKVPGAIKIEKNNNNLKVYNSTSPENSTAPVWNLVQTINNVFTGWTSITQNFGTGNATSSATAIVSNISFGTVIADVSNPCTNGGTFDILSITNTSGNLYNVQFNASGLRNVNVDIKNSSNVSVRNYSLAVSTNPFTFDAGTQLSGIYKLTLTGESCTGSTTKNFTIVGTASSNPIITSNPNPLVTGTSATLTVTGCSGAINWYKLSGSTVTGTLGTNSTLNLSNQVLNDSYYATCTISGVTANSNSLVVNTPTNNGGGGSTIAALATAPSTIVIPEETEWNRFRPEILPAITVPKKLDPITGQMLPNKWFIWHSPFRNMFGYVANTGITNKVERANNELAGMRRIGIMAQLWNFTENCIEANTVNPDGSTCNYTTNQTTLNPLTEVITGGNVLEEDGESPDQWANRAYSDFLGGASFSRFPTVNGKISGLAWVMDGENGYTLGNQQKDANALVNSFSKVSEAFKGYVGNQYFAPNNSLGYMSEGFFAGDNKMHSWWGTANEGTYSGRSNKDNTAILSIAEMGTYYEDMLPEGYILKDQNGNDWFTISHFGTNTGVDIDLNKPGGANTRHWAVQYGGITYKNGKDAHANGHKHLISLKPTNQIGDGYMYSQESQAWHNGKWTFEKGKWGAEYYNQPNVSQSAGDTPLPPYMIEGAVILSMFEAADGIYYWNSAWNKILYPITKTGNARNREHQVDATLDRCPRDYYTYMLKGQVRLGQKFTFSDNSQYSFLDLVSETDTRYLLDQTEYSIDGGTTYVKVEPLGWSKQKLPPVLMVVNDRLAKAFIYSQEAYNECTSRGITTIKVRYNNNVYTVPILANNAPAITGYSLGNVSTTPQNNTVNAPVLTSNPTAPVAGTSVTFTSTGCSGTTKWFNSDAQVSTGSTYTITSPVANTSISATCTVGTVTSVASNIITVGTAPVVVTGVTITEPNRPAYYFSDGHPASYYSNRANLPAIITNASTFVEADVVKLKKDDLEFWFNPNRGGQICYASKGAPINRVYNGGDGGFQWVYDATQYLVGGKLNGQDPGSPQNNVNYNTTMGGDYLNHSQSLIDYHAVENGYYFKFRAILYNFNAIVSEVEMEVTYTLVGKSLKAEYKYTSFRTDGSIEKNNPFRFMGFHIPICFLTNNFTKYSIYTGSSPWTNGGLSEGDIPNITNGAAQSLGLNSKEYTGMVYDPSNNFAVGVLNNSEGGTEISVTYEQLNKTSGSGAGTVYAGPYTTMALAASFAIPDGSNYVRSSTVYFTLGDKDEVRAELKTRAGH